jgi:hypothetical protein
MKFGDFLKVDCLKEGDCVGELMVVASLQVGLRDALSCCAPLA